MASIVRTPSPSSAQRINTDLGPWSPYQGVNITELLTTSPQSAPPIPADGEIWFLGVDEWADEDTPISVWIFYNPGNNTFNNTMRCTLYNATYTTNVSYVNNIQYIQNNLEPQVQSIALPSQLIVYELEAPIESNLTLTHTLQEIQNLWALHEALCGTLTGWIGVTPESDGLGMITNVNSGITNWAGVANWSSETIILPDNLPSKVEQLAVNFTISLIDMQNYPYEPSVMKQNNITSQPIVQTFVPATITSYPAVYAYSRVALWQIYGPALSFTLICVILGGFMLYSNGVAGAMSFSQVLVTTRNPTLDRISQGAGRGGKYITDRVQKVKVRYGRLDGTEFGFGTEDEIKTCLHAEL